MCHGARLCFLVARDDSLEFLEWRVTYVVSKFN